MHNHGPSHQLWPWGQTSVSQVAWYPWYPSQDNGVSRVVGETGHSMCPRELRLCHLVDFGSNPLMLPTTCGAWASYLTFLGFCFPPL